MGFPGSGYPVFFVKRPYSCWRRDAGETAVFNITETKEKQEINIGALYSLYSSQKEMAEWLTDERPVQRKEKK